MRALALVGFALGTAGAACGTSATTPDAEVWRVPDAGPRPDAPLPDPGPIGEGELVAKAGGAALVVDETTVYVLSDLHQAVLAIPTGSGTTVLLATGQDIPEPWSGRTGIAVAGEHVYFSTVTKELASLKRVPRAGGTPEVLATVPVERESPPDVPFALDGDDAYLGVGTELFHVDLAAGVTSLVVTEESDLTSVRLTPDRVVYAYSHHDGPSGVAWQPRAGAPAGVLAGRQDLPGADLLAPDGDRVVLTSHEPQGSPSYLSAIDLDPPAVRPLADSGFGIDVVEVDGAHLYWNFGNWIMRSPRAAEGPVPYEILTTARWPRAFAFDAESLYWLDSSGDIWRLPK